MTQRNDNPDKLGPIHFVAVAMMFMPFWLFPLAAWIL
jgi:hypothetical protein